MPKNKQIKAVKGWAVSMEGIIDGYWGELDMQFCAIFKNRMSARNYNQKISDGGQIISRVLITPLIPKKKIIK